MRVLALDSSTKVGGAALVDNGELVSEITQNVTATHSERLMPAVEALMAGSEVSKPIDLVAVCTGPGSFTGVRIAVATAKSLAYGWKVPIIGVTTLEAMAYQASWQSGYICTMIDARRSQAYYQIFAVDRKSVEQLRPVTEPGAQSVSEILASIPRDEDCIFIGDGAIQYWSAIKSHLGDRALLPPGGFDTLRTASVGFLGAIRYKAGHKDNPISLVPFYLRRSEAEVRWEKKQS